MQSFLRIRLPRFRPPILNVLKAIRIPSICEGSGESGLFSWLDALVGLLETLQVPYLRSFLRIRLPRLLNTLRSSRVPNSAKQKCKKQNVLLHITPYLYMYRSLDSSLASLSRARARTRARAHTHTHTNTNTNTSAPGSLLHTPYSHSGLA